MHGGFEAGATFGDDYLHLSDGYLSDDESDAEAAEIAGLLALAPGARLLDAACGHGRIANRLAMGGFAVVGVDTNADFLARAHRDAATAGAPARYVLGDLRSLPLGPAFDAVVCWYTSFGYFDDAANRRVLSEFRRVLRPGGVLLVGTLHHDGFVRHFTEAPDATVLEVGDDLMVDVSRFDPVLGRVDTDRTVVRGGQVRRSSHFVRLPTVPEWTDWLRQAGFARSHAAGPGGAPLELDTWTMVVLAWA